MATTGVCHREAFGPGHACDLTAQAGFIHIPARLASAIVIRAGADAAHAQIDLSVGAVANCMVRMVNALKEKTPTGSDLLLLDNQLCYALYAAAHRMTKSYRPMLERLGLTYPQYLVLLVLWETNGVTVSEIGRRLRLDSGTLTPVLKRLEGAGLLARNRRQSDEREVEIALTPRGSALRAEASSVREAVMCQLHMSEPQIQAMRIELNALIESLGAGG